MPEISSFYACVSKATIIGSTVPEIRSQTYFFCHFGPFFVFHSHSPNNTENQNFEKMKMSYGDILILNLCSKKQDHMMYAYSGMECDRHNFLLFEVIFCPFTPLLTPKIKIWKKCKKYLLHMCIITQDHIMYCS